MTQVSNLDTNGLMGVRNGAAMELTEREAKLIQFIRDLHYGDIHLFVQAGQPYRAERVKESIMFTGKDR